MLPPESKTFFESLLDKSLICFADVASVDDVVEENDVVEEDDEVDEIL